MHLSMLRTAVCASIILAAVAGCAGGAATGISTTTGSTSSGGSTGGSTTSGGSTSGGTTSTTGGCPGTNETSCKLVDGGAGACCSGSCTDPETDAQNCGQCGIKCSKCVLGLCD